MAQVYSLHDWKRQRRASEVVALALVAMVVGGLPAAILLARFLSAPVDEVTIVAGPRGWDPPIIAATVGRPLRLRVVSWDHTHGLAVDAFGIRAELPAGALQVFELTPRERGVFPFHSHIPCNHGRMQGWLLVGEP